MKEIKEYLKRKINENDTCVLALSGGPDSMCLLNLLTSISAKVICVHINHNTRPSCEYEYQFIKKYTEENNIPLEYFKIDKYEKGRFTEGEARKIRYEEFKKVAKKYQAKYLFTAHHADDLTETIFMRLLRGSSLEGYAGIKKESTWDGITILRPLLSKKKKEIYAYLKENQIPYIEDETNKNDEYIRNRIRHHILPLIEKENENYPTKILQFSETLQKKDALIKEIINQVKEQVEKENKINCQELLKFSPLMQEAYIEEYVKKIYQQELTSISNKHIEIFLKNIKKKNENYTINFPKEYLLYKEDGWIWLEKKISKKSYKIKCENEVILPNQDIVKKITTYESKSNDEIHLNSKEIKLPLYLTTRQVGMKMAVKNLNGHQKVSDILTNCKIRGSKKDEIPILIDSNGVILWILGIKKSKYDLEKDENYDIIYKYIKRKEK